MATPKANIEWNKIPASACVEDRGRLYVAHINGKQAVVFWGSQDAKKAQATLWARSRDGKNERCIGDIKRKTQPLRGLRRRR
jgi:hypothetical protein